MEKEQIIKKFTELGKDINELNKQWDLAASDGQEFGIAVEELNDYCSRRLVQYYKKGNMSRGVKYEGVILGVKMTDFGKTKLIKKAKDMWVEDPAVAIQNGFVNEEGKVLEQNGFSKGEVMDIENRWTKECIGVARKADTEDAFVKVKLSLSGEKARLTVPFYSLMEFTATEGKVADGWKMVGTSNKTDGFVVKQELNDAQTTALIEEHFGKNIVSFKDMSEELVESHSGNFNALAILKGDIAQINITAGDKSNVVHMTESVNLEEVEDMDNIKTITCWVGNGEPINMNENAQGVWMMGRLNKGNDGSVTMNVSGYYCPSVFRKPANIKPVEQANVSGNGESVANTGDKKEWIS